MIAIEIPVTIPQDVNDFVASLGQHEIFAAILEGLPEVFPKLLRIECELDYGVEEDSDTTVVCLVSLPDEGPSDPTPLMRWSKWALQRFSGRELYSFVVLAAYEAQ